MERIVSRLRVRLAVALMRAGRGAHALGLRIAPPAFREGYREGEARAFAEVLRGPRLRVSDLAGAYEVLRESEHGRWRRDLSGSARPPAEGAET